MRFPGEQFILRGWRRGPHISFMHLYDDFIDKAPEDITWNYVSEYALCSKNCKSCLFMVLALLETGYGLKDHKASLIRLYPSLVSISKQHTFGTIYSLVIRLRTPLYMLSTKVRTIQLTQNASFYTFHTRISIFRKKYSDTIRLPEEYHRIIQ